MARDAESVRPVHWVCVSGDTESEYLSTQRCEMARDADSVRPEDAKSGSWIEMPEVLIGLML